MHARKGTARRPRTCRVHGPVRPPPCSAPPWRRRPDRPSAGPPGRLSRAARLDDGDRHLPGPPGQRPDALALATDTAAWLTERGDSARILQFSGPDRVTEAGAEAALGDVDLAGTTVAVSMGGDGTFLRVVRLATAADVPVLGVNFGRLGYLPDLVPDQVREALTRGLRGQGRRSRSAARSRWRSRTVPSPMMPRCCDRAARRPLARLNEVVIEKIDFGHTVRLATTRRRRGGADLLGRRPHHRHATGSTAYNLSAGGPILAPTLRAMVVTPVAPHFSLDRSLVLTDDAGVACRGRPRPRRRAGHRRRGGRAAAAGRHHHLHGGGATRCAWCATSRRPSAASCASGCWPDAGAIVSREPVLTELRVRDLGVIEDLSLTFGPGMTVLTGETGAGKTLVVEALQLVLGGRGQPRHGARRARPRRSSRRASWCPPGPAADARGRSWPARCRPTGRSRAWVDGRMAPSARWPRRRPSWSRSTASTSTARSSPRPPSATCSTPTPAPTSAACARCAASCARSTTALAALGGDAQQRAREADVLRYQVGRDRGGPPRGPRRGGGCCARGGAPGRRRGVPRGGRSARRRSSSPSAGEGGALDLLGRAAAALAGREAFDDYRARLAAAGGRALRRGPLAARRGGGLGGRPGPAGRGPGAPAPAGASCAASTGRTWPPSWPSAPRARRAWPCSRTPRARRRGSRPSTTARAAELAEAEAAVRAVRAGAAGAFGAAVGERLGALAMAGRPRRGAPWQPSGTGEPVELLLGANVGEPVQPLARAASGGELARAMLAIRLVGLGGPQTHGLRRGGRRRRRRRRARPRRRAARGGAPAPGTGGHAPGPGGLPGRRAGQRGEARRRGPHGDDAPPRWRARSG